MNINVKADEEVASFDKTESKRNSMEIHTSEEDEDSPGTVTASGKFSKKKKKNTITNTKSTSYPPSAWSRRTPSLSLGAEVSVRLDPVADSPPQQATHESTSSTGWLGSGDRGDTALHFPVPGDSWSATKPKPRTGYSCKICGKPGGEPDSHWFQLCPKATQNAKNFQPPKHGYVCKLCGKCGGDVDSHWFQQCPSRSSEYAKSQVGNNNMMLPYGEYPIVYAHPGQMYFMPAPQQQVTSPINHAATPLPVHPSPMVGPSSIQPASLATPNWFAASPYVYAPPRSPSHQGHHVAEHSFLEMGHQHIQQQQQQQQQQHQMLQYMTLQQQYAVSPKAHN